MREWVRKALDQRCCYTLVTLNDERNLGVVIVTHDESVAEKASKKIGVLNGRIS